MSDHELGFLLASLRVPALARTKKRVRDAVAEDIVSEATLKTWRTRENIKTRGHAKNRFFTAVRNQLKNAYRDSDRDPELQVLSKEDETKTEAEERVFSYDPRIEDTTILKLGVEEALSRLSDKKYEALMLAARGYDTWEMGEKLDVPRGTAKDRLWRARKEVRDAV